MLELIGLPATTQRVYKWLHHFGTSVVSHFTFSSCFVIETLNFELYRSNLDEIMPMPGSNDPTSTFGWGFRWLHDAHDS